MFLGRPLYPVARMSLDGPTITHPTLVVGSLLHVARYCASEKNRRSHLPCLLSSAIAKPQFYDGAAPVQ
jgi:hypothetical protein